MIKVRMKISELSKLTILIIYRNISLNIARSSSSSMKRFIIEEEAEEIFKQFSKQIWREINSGEEED